MVYSPDHDMNHLLRLAMKEKRAIEAGHLKLEDATALPPGSRLEKGRVISDGDAFFGTLPMIIFMLVVIVAAYELISFLVTLDVSSLQLPKVPSALLLGCGILVLGAVLYWVREHVNSRVYALVEIGLGTGMALQVLNRDENLVQVLAFMAGLRVVVDGITRLVRFIQFHQKMSA